MSFMWMYATARDIERLAGKEFYHQYGQEVIDRLKDEFCPHWSVEEEWPEDEYIVAVINEVKEYHAKERLCLSTKAVNEIIEQATAQASACGASMDGVDLELGR